MIAKVTHRTWFPIAGGRRLVRRRGLVMAAVAVLHYGPFPAAAQPVGNEPTGSLPPTASGSQDAVLQRGAALYAKYCAVCHGEAGDGLGKFAYLMNPRPRNFQKGDFKLATTQNQIPSDEDLVRTIARGMPGSAMPPWGHLPVADLRALAAFIRQFHVNAVKTQLAEGVAAGTYAADETAEMLAQRTCAGPPLVVPPEPGFDSIRWFRGRRLYLESCANCHGADGHPVSEAVKTDEDGYPVPPRSFVNGVFKGGSDAYQLYARIVKGLKGSPMPAYEGVFTGDEVWDLIHYVQSLARQGAQERAQLQQGTFSAPNVRGPLPEGPLDPAWDQARPLYVGLTPLWWTEDRIEGLTVQALHNGRELAVRMVWLDPTDDDRAVRHDEFRDATAIQFSLTSDPPFYMGDAGEHGGVNIWMWKADRQTNIAGGYQDVDDVFPNRAVDDYQDLLPGAAKGRGLTSVRAEAAPGQEMSTGQPVSWPRTQLAAHDPLYIAAWGAGNLVADPTLQTPVECLVARGPGTLSGKPANVQSVGGQAAYQRGVWYVQLQRSMELPHDCEHAAGDERAFKSGDYLPVSFAVWNGGAGDRDGKKNISIWQKLVIE